MAAARKNFGRKPVVHTGFDRNLAVHTVADRSPVGLGAAVPARNRSPRQGWDSAAQDRKHRVQESSRLWPRCKAQAAHLHLRSLLPPELDNSELGNWALELRALNTVLEVDHGHTDLRERHSHLRPPAAVRRTADLNCGLDPRYRKGIALGHRLVVVS